MLKFEEVSGLVAEVATRLDLPKQTIAVTPAGRDTGRVEVLVTLPSHADEPRRVVLDVDRHQPPVRVQSTIETEIRAHLRSHEEQVRDPETHTQCHADSHE